MQPPASVRLMDDLRSATKQMLACGLRGGLVLVTSVLAALLGTFFVGRPPGTWSTMRSAWAPEI